MVSKYLLFYVHYKLFVTFDPEIVLTGVKILRVKRTLYTTIITHVLAFCLRQMYYLNIFYECFYKQIAH